jgi:NCS1 family nucleobase:cation symporter-1
MPKDTGVRGAFWGTYSGCVLGSTLPMVIGAFIGAAFPTLGTADGIRSAAGGGAGVVLFVFAFAVATTNAANLYGGSLSVLTFGQTLFPRWKPSAMMRSAVCAVLFGIALLIGVASSANFLANFNNLILLLGYVLIPWTAINLVDYYLVRHGVYDIPSLFETDGGKYGRFNIPAVACYFIGILVELPFISNGLFTGPAARALDGTDTSWLVGLAIIAPVYFAWARTANARQRVAAEPVRVAQ